MCRLVKDACLPWPSVLACIICELSHFGELAETATHIDTDNTPVLSKQSSNAVALVAEKDRQVCVPPLTPCSVSVPPVVPCGEL